MNVIPIPARQDLRKYITGEIVASDDPFELSEDMVEVALPNGILIYAGWYDHDDAKASYRIYVDYDLARLIPYLETDDPRLAASEVATLAGKYENYPVRVSDSESTKTRCELVG
jgi:hypothetical protein